VREKRGERTFQLRAPLVHIELERAVTSFVHDGVRVTPRTSHVSCRRSVERGRRYTGQHVQESKGMRGVARRMLQRSEVTKPTHRPETSVCDKKAVELHVPARRSGSGKSAPQVRLYLSRVLWPHSMVWRSALAALSRTAQRAPLPPGQARRTEKTATRMVVRTHVSGQSSSQTYQLSISLRMETLTLRAYVSYRTG